MHYERLKTIILLLLIVLSFVLSFSLWSGWRQYDALPEWLLQPTSVEVITNVEEPLPSEPDRPETVLLEPTQMLGPERMIVHDQSAKYLFWMQSDSLLQMQWQTFGTLMDLGQIQRITAMSADKWWQSVENQVGCEFILSVNCPLNVLFPNIASEEAEGTLKVDRIFVSEELRGGSGQTAAIYVRSIYDHTFYQVEVALPQDSTLLMNWDANNYNWVEAQMIKDETFPVGQGVYVPKNLTQTHAGRFPEVWVKYEDISKSIWLPMFFNNINIVREITFSDDQKRVYVDGPVKLTMDYSKGTAIKYAKAPLMVLNSHTLVDDTSAETDSMTKMLTDTFDFVATHNPNNWPPLSGAVRLDALTVNLPAHMLDVSFKCFTVNTEFMIPIEAPGQILQVGYKDGMVSTYDRSVLLQGRKNSQPKLALEADAALQALAKADWPLGNWRNPHAAEVTRVYQSYLEQDYLIEDIYLGYYSKLDNNRGEFITPHWVIVLVSAEGQAVKFYVNAMTGYLPLDNGISFTP